MFYGIRLKGQDDENWTDVYSLVSSSDNQLVPENTSSENTVIVFPQWGFYVYGEVDFQVEAVILTAQPFPYMQIGTWTVDGTSNWSATQTVTVPTFSFYPTSTPTQFSTSFLLITNTISLIVIAILLVVIIALVLRHRKTANLSK